MPRSGIPGLAELARLHGVQSFYYDISNERRSASPEAILALLRALGAPVEGAADVADALRLAREQSWRSPCEPIHLAWDGRVLPLEMRLPAEHANARARCTLTLEEGDARVWIARLDELDVEAEHEADGRKYIARKLPLPTPLPPGYHHLAVEGVGTTAECLIISTPKRAYGPTGCDWGVFLPLYALRSKRSLAIGDFTDLRGLAEWVGSLGGSAIGTLPLFAAFLEPGEGALDPSPYSPASRLFWNDIYLDLERAPGLENAPEAARLLASRQFRRAAREEVGRDLIDWRRAASLKRQVIDELVRAFNPGDVAFMRFAATRPRLQDYARFRAAWTRQGRSWQEWPAPMRDGRIRPGDVDEHEVRYHMYVQWAATLQLAELSGRTDDQALEGDGAMAGWRDGGRDERAARPVSDTRPGGARHRALAPSDVAAADPTATLYLDIPLGVNRAGYDVWANRDLFPDGISVGAPPDALFSGGQDWGFPPMHPETLRRTGYRYFIDSLRTVMPYAGALRFDHVMSLHRLYWIPPGFGAKEGTYVRYHADEFYAILALESHRHRTRIVGEDLGTVPQEVRAGMGSHHIGRMYVLQYEAEPSKKTPVGAVVPGAVASLNTHDMPTFAAFWNGDDIGDRQDLGLIDARTAGKEHKDRQKLRDLLTGFLEQEGWLDGDAEPAAVLRAAIEYLASSDAWLTLAGLEDLMGETRPQNVPGTSEERPNWRRRARLSLEEMRGDAAIAAVLRSLNDIRRDPRNRNG